MHRQSLELAVGSETQAREIHAELSETFGGRLSSALDEVFSAACVEDETLRIDRIDLNLGALSREHLPELLAQRARDRLAAILGSGREGEPQVSDDTSPVRRLGAREVALERLATFLASGALVARDRRVTREELEAEFLRLLDEAPEALAGLLRTLPPAATAQRLARQFSPSIALRVAALLGGVAIADLEALIGEWRVVLAVMRLPKYATGREASVEASREPAVERFLEVLVELRDLSRALRMLADRLVAERSARAGAATLVDDVASVLPETSRIRQTIEHAARDRGFDRGSVASSGGTTTTQAGDGVKSESAVESTGPTELVAGRPVLPQPPEDSIAPDVLPAEPCERAGRAVDRAEARPREFSGAQERQRSLEREREATAPRLSPAQEEFRVEKSGLVILWPFLAGFFEALGLVADRRFMSDAACRRAVLLSAHLCDGADEWGEHELLLGKILCGHPPFDPIETRIGLSNAERGESRALLESVIGHWAALKSTSIDGLRGAFLHREGTLTAQEQGWKLEVVRLGHDVLLDKLPWGFGLVLLPWMEQPLYVEW
ncbi:MAG: hypothetical protein A3H35_17090 [Betaproteobacteria bacterium RIFCSPLOWO2_02_FULL_62_17]|nr:MAG: hypothetical protein A3H35_17090 [Betaproteobacteria bacterium RIFCSPLOWO2_02_FULL_62_17]